MRKKVEKHGLTGTRIYRIWKNIKARCENKNRGAYRRGKNIHVGMFPNQEDAAKARDMYIVMNNLEGFRLNFS